MASISKSEITVVGAGVAGMTTAITLQEAGFRTEIRARAFSPHTTSDLAGALWYPSHAWPREKTRAWGLHSLNEFMRIRENEGEERTGIRLIRGTRHFYRQMGFPWWKNHVSHFRILTEWERPERVRTSYEYEVPVMDMPVYLGSYLKQRYLRAGGEMHTQDFGTWTELLDSSAPTVVNCTGLGSHTLLDDKVLYPVRGQSLQTTEKKPEHFVLSADHPEGSIYVIPRGNGVVIGGGSFSGVWDTEVDVVHSERTKRLASLLNPDLQNVSEWKIKVGLRPGRKFVRCERDTTYTDKTVLHNYGHGGAGVTLSWGCASEIRDLLKPNH